MTYTHQIVRMERGATKNSGSPMWRCRTADGESVNVFSHSDPAKDNTVFFKEAGYFDLMDALKVGEALEWNTHPIPVTMEKTPDGKWWSVVAVAPKPADAEPDVMWQPNLRLYQQRAQRLALMIVTHGVRILDVETTGLGADDEIVAVAVLDENSQVCYESLISPRHPEKLLRVGKGGQTAADVTGLLPEMVDDAPEFDKVWNELHGALDGSHWCAYNAKFDCEALDRECSNYDLPLLTNSGVWDAAQIAAEYLGHWNEKRQWWEMLKLSDAATQLGIQIEVSHQAGADARTTLALLKAIANDVLGEPF